MNQCVQVFQDSERVMSFSRKPTSSSQYFYRMLGMSHCASVRLWSRVHFWNVALTTSALSSRTFSKFCRRLLHTQSHTITSITLNNEHRAYVRSSSRRQRTDSESYRVQGSLGVCVIFWIVQSVCVCLRFWSRVLFHTSLILYSCPLLLSAKYDSPTCSERQIEKKRGRWEVRGKESLVTSTRPPYFNLDSSFLKCRRCAFDA